MKFIYVSSLTILLGVAVGAPIPGESRKGKERASNQPFNPPATPYAASGYGPGSHELPYNHGPTPYYAASGYGPGSSHELPYNPLHGPTPYYTDPQPGQSSSRTTQSHELQWLDEKPTPYRQFPYPQIPEQSIHYPTSKPASGPTSGGTRKRKREPDDPHVVMPPPQGPSHQEGPGEKEPTTKREHPWLLPNIPAVRQLVEHRATTGLTREEITKIASQELQHYVPYQNTATRSSTTKRSKRQKTEGE